MVVDAVVWIQGLELDALVQVLADGTVRLLERVFHDEDRWSYVHAETLLLQDVGAPARPLQFFDDGDLEAHAPQAQGRSQSAHACTDDDD